MTRQERKENKNILGTLDIPDVAPELDAGDAQVETLADDSDAAPTAEKAPVSKIPVTLLIDGQEVQHEIMLDWALQRNIVIDFHRRYQAVISHLIDYNKERSSVESDLNELLTTYRTVFTADYRNFFLLMYRIAPRVLVYALRFPQLRSLFLEPHDYIEEMHLFNRMLKADTQYYKQIDMEAAIFEQLEKNAIAALDNQNSRRPRRGRPPKGDRLNPDTLEAIEQQARQQAIAELMKSETDEDSPALQVTTRTSADPLPTSRPSTRGVRMKTTQDYERIEKARRREKIIAAMQEGSTEEISENILLDDMDAAGNLNPELTDEDFNSTLAIRNIAGTGNNSVSFKGSVMTISKRAAQAIAHARNESSTKNSNRLTFVQGNLNTNVLQMRHLASINTVGPLDGRRFRPTDILADKSKAGRRRTHPYTFELRKTIETLADYVSRDDLAMHKLYKGLLTNFKQLEELFEDHYHRIIVKDQAGMNWHTLVPADTFCLILKCGCNVTLRNCNQTSQIYQDKDLNGKMIILEGLDFRAAVTESLDGNNSRRGDNVVISGFLNSYSVTTVPVRKTKKQIAEANKKIQDQLDYEIIYITL